MGRSARDAQPRQVCLTVPSVFRLRNEHCKQIATRNFTKVRSKNWCTTLTTLNCISRYVDKQISTSPSADPAFRVEIPPSLSVSRTRSLQGPTMSHEDTGSENLVSSFPFWLPAVRRLARFHSSGGVDTVDLYCHTRTGASFSSPSLFIQGIQQLRYCAGATT